MSKRPISVTIISCLFVMAGTIGILYHAAELKDITTIPEVIWILVVRLLAIVGGVFALSSAANWARWLLLAWIFYHTIISFFHTSAELIMHTAVMIITIVALFHPKANAYFRTK